MFGIVRPDSAIEPLGRIEIRLASSSAIKVVREGGTISDINDSFGHDRLREPCFKNLPA
jgi:hypothetical protein